jgi:hypothetical protein
MANGLAKRAAEQSAPIWLKFRINPRYMDKVKDFMDIQNRPEKQEARLTLKRMREAEKMGFQGDAYDRTDAAGNAQADTGLEMFHNGKPGNALSLRNVCVDLKDMGYKLTDVHSFQKQNDNMAFIVFIFDNKFSDKVQPMNPPQALKDLLKKLIEMHYEHVHIWDNPDLTVTINCAHINHNMQFPELRMHRVSSPTKQQGTDIYLPYGIYMVLDEVSVKVPS